MNIFAPQIWKFIGTGVQVSCRNFSLQGPTRRTRRWLPYPALWPLVKHTAVFHSWKRLCLRSDRAYEFLFSWRNSTVVKIPPTYIQLLRSPKLPLRRSQENESLRRSCLADLVVVIRERPLCRHPCIMLETLLPLDFIVFRIFLFRLPSHFCGNGPFDLAQDRFNLKNCFDRDRYRNGTET